MEMGLESLPSPKELYDESVKTRQKFMDGFKSMNDIFETDGSQTTGENPIVYWSRISESFMEMPDSSKIAFLNELMESHANLLSFVRTMMFNLIDVCKLVEVMANIQEKHEDEVQQMLVDTHTLWRAVDDGNMRITNLRDSLRKKTNSFAIISGGKSNESNIPGCDKSDSSTTGEGAESITEDSPQK